MSPHCQDVQTIRVVSTTRSDGHCCHPSKSTKLVLCKKSRRFLARVKALEIPEREKASRFCSDQKTATRHKVYFVVEAPWLLIDSRRKFQLDDVRIEFFACHGNPFVRIPRAHRPETRVFVLVCTGELFECQRKESTLRAEPLKTSLPDRLAVSFHEPIEMLASLIAWSEQFPICALVW